MAHSNRGVQYAVEFNMRPILQPVPITISVRWRWISYHQVEAHRLVIGILVRMTNQYSKMTEAKLNMTTALLKKTNSIEMERLRWVSHY